MSIKLATELNVLVSPGIVLVDKIRFASEVNDLLGKIFTGEPLVIPLPEDAPPDVPRIILKSKEGEYLLQISLNQLHFLIQYGNNKDDKYPNTDYQEKLLKLFNYLTEKIHAHFERIANITNWIFQFQKIIGIETIMQKLFQKETPISTPNMLQIDYAIRNSADGFRTNEKIRIKSERQIPDTQKEKDVQIRIDLSTAQEEKYNITKDELKRFLNVSYKRVNTIISMYKERMKE